MTVLPSCGGHLLDDLAASGQSEEARAAGLELLEDERKFIDLARSPLWLNEEISVLP